MKLIIRGALLGGLVEGGLVFLAMLIVGLAEGPRLHNPPPYLVAGIYGAAGAVLGVIVGAIVGAVFAHRKD